MLLLPVGQFERPRMAGTQLTEFWNLVKLKMREKYPDQKLLLIRKFLPSV